MDKLKLHSPNLTQENMARIRDLFPNCVTEARDEDGKVKLAMDFDLLRQELSESIVEGPQERYRLDWPGKREALLTANAPIAKTLRPCREESVDFDTTTNLFIEGDNLDALKLLQETYLGKVKMIYIDPPYNTGNDFIYEDDFAENTDEFLRRSNQKDEEGNRLVANTESNGRFHSDWLSMMYPRLKLARNLLREDGVIFISCDDSEISNLKKLCAEIFGEVNFVATLVWEKGRKNDAKLISVGHEYILVFLKNKSLITENKIRWRESKPGAKEILAQYIILKNKFGDDYDKIEGDLRTFYENLPKNHPSKKHVRYNKVDERGVWRDDNMSWPGGGGPTYDVIHPLTGFACAVPDGGWRYSTPEKMREMIQAGKVIFRNDHTLPPMKKTYLLEIDDDYDTNDISSDETENNDNIPIQVAGSYFYRSALQASSELTKLFGMKIFNNPKDKEVLCRWISYVGTNNNDIVMDFFAGSGTTADAIINLNAIEDKTIRYIIVQLPEKINLKQKGAKLAISFLESLNRPINISEITKERIRRAGAKIKAELAAQHSQNAQGSLLGANTQRSTSLDIGFRVLKVDSSNMADVYYTPDTLNQQQLSLLTDNIKLGRTPEDLLFQVLLDWGVDLTLPIRMETILGKTVFFVDENVLVACFDTGLTEELVKELARVMPLRVVFRDTGFASDAVKINATQIFRQLSPGTEVKTI